MTEHPIPRGFLERARREAERYGDDPWILLRELVQNSRDAGARRIRFAAAVSDGWDQLSCVDDGSGMTRREMRSYLLRLYASGKAPARGESSQDRARGPVGRFGVGFWSVLRFGPTVIRVESRAGEEGTAFEVDCAHEVIREVSCDLSRHGTRVTLLRPAKGGALINEAKERLSHWASFVRGLGAGDPPQLTFNGAALNASFAVPELIGDRVRGDGFDGVVGLHRRPRVLLYAHGLLIREAASLEEILPKRPPRADLDTPGLYAVVQVNADGLEVLMNRREVVEDALLEDIVATCERRLLRLQRQLVDRLAPMRLFDRLRVTGPRSLPLVGAMALSVAVGGATYAALSRDASSRAVVSAADESPAARSPGDGLDLSAGPRINQPSLMLDGGEVWDIHLHTPMPSSYLVKIATLARADDRLGLVADPPLPIGAYDGTPRAPGSVGVDMGLTKSAALTALPVPSGHGVVRGSVRVGRRRATLERGQHGEPLLRHGAMEERVRYTTAPASEPRPAEALLVAPTSWPRAAARVLDDVRGLSSTDRVARLAAFVKSRVGYTTSLDDAARFDAARGSFIERALTVGAGDCDVMNVVFALMMRAAGVPARVAVGLVVDDGDVAPDLHAWTEYWSEGGWHTLDVSPPVPVATADLAVASSSSFDEDDLPVADDDPRAPSPVPLGRAALALVGPASSSPTPPPSPLLSRARSFVGEVRDPVPPPLLGGALAGTGALLLLVALTTLPFARRRRDGDEEALGRLLWHWLRGPRSSDPLHLRLRPYFPTVNGSRRLSLADLERLATRGRLLAGARGDPFLPSLRSGVVVVDSGRRGVARLLSLVPEVMHLEELRPILKGEAPPLLREVEEALRRIDDDVRLHMLPGASSVREVELPVRARELPPRHLLIGERDPRWRSLLEDTELSPALRRFRAARFVLEQTTLYREQRDGLLALLAEEATA